MIRTHLCIGVAAATALTAGVHARQMSCGSDVKPHEAAQMVQMQELGFYDLPDAAFGGTITVPITFHIVRQDDGTGGLDPTDLTTLRAALNVAYAGAQIQFCQPGATNYIDNDDFFFNINTDAELDALRMTDVVPNTINIYFTPNLHLCGKSSFTSSAVQGIVMQNTCQGYTDISGVLIHEVGHYFDLYHTHETAFGDECVNGSNCSTAGDLLCDTPADFNLNFEGCVDPDTCANGCTVSGPCTGDGNYNPSTLNYMSYTAVPCLSAFTTQGRNRAYATLVNLRPELQNTLCNNGGGCGSTGAGSCYEANGTPGCNSGDCCQTVCQVDPFCCDTEWDSICVDEAFSLCGNCGGAGAGDCFTANGSPGCNNSSCCEMICVADPFCCNVAWDSLCADAASETCPPSNDLCTSPIGLSCNTTIVGSTAAATTDEGFPSCGGDVTSPGVWYILGGTGSPITLSLCNAATTFDSKIGVYTGSCASGLTCIAGNDQFCGNQSEVTFNSTVFETYWILIHGFGGSAGPFELQVTCVIPECGDSGTGSCFEANSTVACEDAACCELVCDIDPYCCNTNWDNICANEALAQCAAPCIADVNDDMAVDVFDLLDVLDDWGACPPSCPPFCDSDTNEDCGVDVFDLLNVLDLWGPCP